MAEPGIRRLSAGSRILLAAALISLPILGVAHADVIAGGNAKVTFTGTMAPSTLPRAMPQPISVEVHGRVRPVENRRPPALRKFVIAFTRHARVTTHGLPTCQRDLLHARTTKQALAICRDALVGTGRFTAHIDVPDQAPFPSSGRVLAFNTTFHGRPALVGHVYGRKPVPTIEVLPLVFGHTPKGAFGLTVSAIMPDVGDDEWGYVTGFDLSLGRSFQYRGRPRSFLTASCPAPPDIPIVSFKLARGTFYLRGGETRTRVLSGVCRAKATENAQ
jgi:hypothetical protein